MKTAERVVIVVILLLLVAAGVWIYYAVGSVVTVSATDTSVPEGSGALIDSVDADVDQSNWRLYYPVTSPITIGTTTVLASVAETVPERIQGLSDTPYLPENVVKLFVFGSEGAHSIWMKDMQYPLDIMWANRAGELVHIEENVSPDTFPESFRSPVPAWYVIEANAGFVAEQQLQIGDVMTRVE
jgi:uncharacterized membrane protein (UPF0127 family)